MALNIRPVQKATRLVIAEPFIQTGERPQIVPHVVPHMGTTPAPRVDLPPVWRVADTDIDEFMPWLFPKLQERWPRIDLDAFVFWLRSSRADPKTLIVRSKGCVGAFVASLSVLEPWPTVNEMFVRCNTRESEDWLLVYDHAYKWAMSISARECRFGLDTDAKLGEMRREGADFGVDLGRQRAFYVSPVKE